MDVLNMENDDSSDSNERLSNEDMLEQAKKLLTLTDLVDKYPEVVEKRVNGLIFVLIGGGISIAGLIFITLMPILEAGGMGLFGVMLFITANLLISWIISFRLIAPLMRSYGELDASDKTMSTEAKVFWGILASVIIITALVSFGTGQTWLFAPLMQTTLFLGNIANYFEAKKGDKQSSSAFIFLIYAILIGISILPILLFPTFAFTIMIAVDIGGLYAMGIYNLLTAERILVETLGRD
jgi:hypothetical protein